MKLKQKKLDFASKRTPRMPIKEHFERLFRDIYENLEGAVQYDKWDGTNTGIYQQTQDSNQNVYLKPTGKHEVIATVSREKNIQVQGEGKSQKKRADMIFDDIDGYIDKNDCDVRYDDYGEFVAITLNCAKRRRFNVKEIELEHKRDAGKAIAEKIDELGYDIDSEIDEVLGRYRGEEGVE